MDQWTAIVHWTNKGSLASWKIYFGSSSEIFLQILWKGVDRISQPVLNLPFLDEIGYRFQSMPAVLKKLPKAICFVCLRLESRSSVNQKSGSHPTIC